MGMSINIETASQGAQTLRDLAPANKSSSGGRTVSIAQTGYRTATVSSRAEVLALAGDWRNLEKSSQGTTVFQAFDICLPWLTAYVFADQSSHQARIITVYDESGALIALVPLAIRKRGVIHMAEWIGEPLIQYGDMLMDPGADRAALRTVINHTVESWSVDGLYLRNVRADSRIADVLELSVGPDADPTHARLNDDRVTAIADLKRFDSAEAYFDSFSKRSRKTRRRKRRDMEALGALSLERVKAGPRAVELTDLALNWKKAWLAERGLSSRTFLDVKALETLRTTVGRESDGNPFQLFVQKLNDVPVAIEISLVSGEGCASFIGTYDPSYDEMSPGKVQMESTIRYGYEQGWPAYDMLAPMSEYKQSWSNTTVDVADYMLPSSLLGMAYRDAFLRGLRPATKALFLALPANLRSRLIRSTTV
jgi:CelD/BcsL family acetyltransferase involved in cellulose biosynthesis